jgi:hypothetical protein
MWLKVIESWGSHVPDVACYVWELGEKTKGIILWRLSKDKKR